MSYLDGRLDTGRRFWRRKSITTLAVAALIGGGFIAAPAAVAAPGSSPVSVSTVTVVPQPSISGSVKAGSTVRLNIGDLEQAFDWGVEWYLDGVWQDVDSWGPEYPYVFTIPANAVGKRLSVRGWVFWPDDEAQEYDVDGGIVIGKAFTKTGTPTIGGASAVGKTLTAQPGTWSPNVTFGYQWLRNGKIISGATKSNYSPSAADVNQSVAVKVTATKVGYTTLFKTSAAKKIEAGSLKPAQAATVSGTAKYGSTLKVSTKWPSGAKATYQWYRGSSKINGATKASYKLTKTDIGKTMKVGMTVTRSGYATYKTSAKSAKIGKASFSIKTAPKITGIKKAGHTLKVSKGRYSATPSLYGYQWYRGAAKIKGATKSSYKLTMLDRGKRISARVTVKRSSFSPTSFASKAVSISVPPRTVISRDGTYKVGTGIKPGLYKASSSDGCYWATLQGFSGSLSDINNNYFGTGNTYVRIKASDKGFKTSRCGNWKTVSSSGANASKITKDGTYRVGVDIKAGTYVSNGKGNSCYWATLDDFTEDLDDLRDNYIGSARTIVEIPKDAKGFKVHRCGTLVRE
ncbi:hypothetical protein [Arthrobacter sulfonylureivorans]|uniref:Ig-like domain-containing protein n=1 Tax=Arthrobacter sulfonylureivorans TaxID=2486855 RepID=A0ABY3WDC7_9MICC|nr:hypothetical protein [Arthrobacter sulfonylureivorans]UNK47422.1 hypothetical protein MNQ99_08875 [Arthrobacter sulfonylureivorans]